MALSVKTIGVYAAFFASGAVSVAALGWVAGGFVGPAPDGVTTPPADSDTASVQSGDGITAIGSLQRNQVVTIQGVVESIRDEDDFVLRDATGSVTVWTGEMMFPVQPGETLTVWGFVDNDLVMEVYAQEITRESGEVMAVARSGAGEVEPESTPAANLTPIGSLVRGSFVTIAGMVEEISDEDEFFLRDDTGSVKVWTGGELFPVSPGEQVTVRGFVDDDLLLEVYAQEIITADGEVIVLGGYSSSQ